MAENMDMSLSMEEDEFEKEVETDVKKYLAFCADNLEYAIDVDYVIEIIMNTDAARLPRVPDYIYGVMNLRGQVVPVIDFRLRLGRTKTELTSSTCIIICEISEMQFGLLIDSVSQMIDIDQTTISKPPLSSDQRDLVNGVVRVDGRVLLIVSSDDLLKKPISVR